MGEEKKFKVKIDANQQVSYSKELELTESELNELKTMAQSDNYDTEIFEKYIDVQNDVIDSFDEEIETLQYMDTNEKWINIDTDTYEDEDENEDEDE